MAIPLPNIQLLITPPNGVATDYSQYLTYSGAFNQIEINQNFGRQGDTAQITLVDEYASTPHFTVPVMSQIKLVDVNLGVTLFAGVVVNPTLIPTSPNTNEWYLKCTDYTFYADNSTPVYGPFYNGYTADQVVIAVTQQANCGITAKSTSQGGFVAPAVLLPSVAVNYQPLSTAWRMLARQASQVTPYGWYVDENLQLHFYDSSSAIDSGVTFTTNPTVGGSTTEGHIKTDSMFGFEADGTTIHNKILVAGAWLTVPASTLTLYPVTGTFIFDRSVATATDVWTADGSATAWPLRYTFGGISNLRVNYFPTLVTHLQPGQPPNGKPGQWYVQQNANGQWFLTAPTPPAAGSTIAFWYAYKVPIIAQANDFGSQQAYSGPNRGIFGHYVSDSGLTTASMALARAQRERAEYAYAVERITFNTSPDWVGWVRSGQVFTMINQFLPDSRNNNSWGLTSRFLCVQNRIMFTKGGYREMTISGIRI